MLNESEGYREAGAGWVGPIVLTLDEDPARGVPEGRSVRLDLAGGSCRGAQATSNGDAVGEATVIAGSPVTWSRVLRGDVDPLFALMSGKLQLRSGSLAALMPHARSAKELVATARTVPTRFPDGWDGGTD